MKITIRAAHARMVMNFAAILAVLVAALGVAAPAFASAPSNDNFNTPVAATSSSMTFTMSDTSFNAATDGTNDPNVCGYGNPGVHTVWYTFMPTANGSITLSTVGSGFDTILAIWTGTSGNLQAVACNDDTATGLQAVLTKVSLKAYTKYYIEVVQFTQGTSAPQKPFAPKSQTLSTASSSASYLILTLSYSTTTKVLTPGKYDDKSTLFTYVGTWSNSGNASAYMGSYKITTSSTAVSTFVFKGNSFNLIYTAASNMGTMKIYVDGILADTLDESSASTAYQQVYSYNGPALSDDLHLVRLRMGSKRINLDAVEVFAPPDLIPPAAITDLAAAPGSVYGNVDLSWTAPGNDGLDGVASSYDVRYSSSQILTETDWDAATQITSGVPAPGIPGSTQTMSVSGLPLNQTFYFAARALDEPAPDSTPGGLSNSPSASPSYPGPFGTGKYDDALDAAKWMYSGSWSNPKAAGAYKGSYHLSSKIGDSATFIFYGQQFNFYYSTNSYGALVDVFVDGSLENQINQKSSTQKWQLEYTSGTYTLDMHTVQLVHHSGSRMYVDAIEVVGPPDVSNPQTITDLGAVTGSTVKGSVALTWTAPAEDQTGSLPASWYDVRYSTSDITDASTWDSATSFANTLYPKNQGQPETLTVAGLAPGITYYFAVRAVDEAGNIGDLGPSASATAMSAAPVGAGTYDDKDSNWIYYGSWSVLSASSAYKGAYRRSSQIGASATLVFNGSQFIFIYETSPYGGKVDVIVDGVTVDHINEYSATQKWKVTYTSNVMASEQHVVQFVLASGSRIFVDGITINP